MIAFLVGATDFQKHAQVDVKKTIKAYQVAIVKAQKEKEATKSQFIILKSEKEALNKTLEEVKATQDEAIAMANSLKFEQEILVQVAKEEVEEKVAKAIIEKDEAIKTLEKEKADQKTVEATIKEETKEETISDILKYEMSYRHSVLFMIKRKYPDLDLYNIDFTQIEGYNVLDPTDGSELIGDLNVERATQVAVRGGIREEGTGEIQVEGVGKIQVEGTEDINFNPFSLGIEFDVNLPINEEELVNVPSNQDN